VTASTHLRKPIFTHPKYALVVLDALKWLDRNALLNLDTAIVMPDHAHVVLQLKQAPLPVVAQKLKGFTARSINKMMARTGPLWQPGYHDRAIRKDERLNEIRRYCLNNPVRSNLVARFEHYPYRYCVIGDGFSLD
jgi:putative transposase